ncbi:hypothetical protein M9H77_04065 [Catharanthus roseus]|uniref:Uncharacterized protein n=1 Tax=Catharanthus roseus TaxID=4058 RepID=A0ACC0CD11_CATRO|nr:hypothetical protein M9H77_04065 [Catharanthus roseus]
MAEEGHQVAVVMVPFPAQGHLNQLLHLSRLISSYNIPIHYVCTPSHGRQAKIRVHGWDPLSVSNIHFHEFPTPSFISPPPNPHAAIKFPAHLQPSFDSSSYLRTPVSGLLRKLSAKFTRVVIIHDSLMGSVIQDFVTLFNTESYTFHSVSAFCLFFFLWERIGIIRPSIDEKLLKIVPSIEGCFTPEFLGFVKNQHDVIKYNSGRIYNSNRAIEGPFLDLLGKEEITDNKKQWALGPFNPVVKINGQKGSERKHECLNWLDKQSPNSVIFISFGTTTSLSDEQIREIAIGLEKSQQKFIWVLRDADKGDVFNVQGLIRSIELPDGFEKRIQGKGLLVRNWAPQLEILEHFATGGFMSHCGWNSCMESLSMGVPMATWPMHSDQPRNAALITEILRVGLVVKEWCRRDEVIKASEVEKVVRDLMGSDSEIGAELRKRAAELGVVVRRSMGEGGVTRKELDDFIAHIIR